MKIFIIIILLFLVKCEDKNIDDKANINQVKYGILFSVISDYKETTLNYIDNKDGTVSVHSIRKTNGEDLGQVALFKKCLQGQVYRQTENDCKGTGSESDNYGALKLQFCDKLDMSCNSVQPTNTLVGVLNGSNSEIYQSCGLENFFKKNWKVITRSHFSVDFDMNKINSTIMDGTEIWTDSGLYDSLKYAYTIKWNQDYYTSDLKTNRHYLLCSEKEKE